MQSIVYNGTKGARPMKKIPYGISDFRSVLAEDFYYIDKTSFIEKLENYGRFLYLIRPRRFGKSLFVNMLDFYYNVRWEKDWELLKGNYIYEHPTKERHSYHVLKFDFSAVSTKGSVDDNFSKECNITMDYFLKSNNINLTIDIENQAHDNLKLIFTHLKQTTPNIKIYILIDEYDNFINNLLVNDKQEYERLTSSTEAVYKEFFKLLKALTNENNSPLKRMFFTGVSPLALFDVTSGSNIGKNITNEFMFNDAVGVTQENLDDMFSYYKLDKDYFSLMQEWYNNYKFNKNVKHTIYNTDMAIYFIDHLIHSQTPPDNLVDINVRTDYGKLKYLVHANNKLNGNFNALKTLFTKGFLTIDVIKDSFSAIELTKQENFISLLYYLGLVTIDKSTIQGVSLKIPNQTISQIMAEFVKVMLEDTNTYSIDLQKFHQMTVDLAINNSLEVFKYIADELDNNTSIRDLVNQESDIKMFYMVYFTLNRVYTPISELELNKGYADILLTKTPYIKEDIPNILIEFKFFKQSEKPNIDEAVNKAKEQIIQYKQSKKIRVDKSVIVVFHGFKMVYCK